LIVGAVAAFSLTSFVLLDYRVRSQFGETQWRVPTRVYTQAFALHDGRAIDIDQAVAHLERLGYRRNADLSRPGHYRVDGRTLHAHARAFDFADGRAPARRVRARFADGAVTGVDRGRDEAAIIRFEPERLGQVYAGRRADRILLRRDDVPDRLVDVLIAVEDRDFYTHWGIDISAIARAAWANLQAGTIVQGASTLTQQLAKNFFLSGEQTLGRKFTEALMALSLEWHYSKEALLEAYLNEVYLGQDGDRSIHGFGLGARFWFNRPLDELSLDETALLVGLIRGPSYYDPREHPERARARRDTVLRVLARTGVASRERVRAAMDEPLGVVPRERVRLASYPAYLDLVRRQLAERYPEEQLAQGGLRVFTHLDPLVQNAAQGALQEGAARLGSDDLQGAVVVAAPESGALHALVGDRRAGRAGYNRALRANRSIGSLVKPAVYYTALARPERYTLTTRIRDEPLAVELDDGDTWRPQNFDGEFAGEIPLLRGLVDSRNAATARLGLDLGLERVGETLARLDAGDGHGLMPADLLGAIALSPLEVTGMYQTLAAGGFDAPLRTVRAVRTRAGESLGQSGLSVDQALAPGPVFLVNSALDRVTREGTAAALQRLLPGRRVAGKTGTTDDLRDSWFAGFDGRRVGVVWLGHDDNSPTGLTGSSGALRVWADMMARLPAAAWDRETPPGVEWASVDLETNRAVPGSCDGAERLPFIEGSVPARTNRCRPGRGGIR